MAYKGPNEVVSSGSSTDNALSRWDSTGGQRVQDSGAILSDADALSGITQLNVDNIQVDGNTISSTDTNGDVNLTPNGTGTVVVGTDLDIDNINIDGNTISSTDTNGNIILSPNGTGVVETNDISATAASNLTITLGDAAGTNSLTIQNTTPATLLTLTSEGEQNLPLQPCFSAYVNTTITNVTGAGTGYTIIYDSTLFDQTSDFNTTTGTFTAPITGKYYLSVQCTLEGITTSHTQGLTTFQTSNRRYRNHQGNIGAEMDSGNTFTSNGSTLADIDAADTVTIALFVSGGTDVIDVSGVVTNLYRNVFTGILQA